MNWAMTIVDFNFPKRIASIIDPEPGPNDLADCKEK
jgi:hypothetical protein